MSEMKKKKHTHTPLIVICVHSHTYTIPDERVRTRYIKMYFRKIAHIRI